MIVFLLAVRCSYAINISLSPAPVSCPASIAALVTSLDIIEDYSLISGTKPRMISISV
jgi:hypothetical protein